MKTYLNLNNLGTRGFLSNYPDDVVYLVNGTAITKADILQYKHACQRRELAAKRRNWSSSIKPCFIWVFWTNGLGDTGFFRGWWLYIHTLKFSREIGLKQDRKLALKVMKLFPCGYLPLVENFELWKAVFATAYYRPTKKRPDKQGMTVAWVEISSSNIIIDIIKKPRRENGPNNSGQTPII